jgi:hypothetical protein
VDVAAGTYNEHNITINKSLTVTGDPGDASPGAGVNAPVVDGQDLYTDAFLIANGTSGVTIQGFEICHYVNHGGGGEGNAVQAWVASTSNITVADNYMHDLGWNGVLVGNDGAIGDHSYWTVARNILSNFGTGVFDWAGYGMELTNTSHGVIEDNIITAGALKPGSGILVTARRPSEVDMTIRRNEISGEFDYYGVAVYAWNGEASNASLSGLIIENNSLDISGPCTYALSVRDIGGAVTDVAITGNKLVKAGGPGLRSTTAQTINASGNWWGSNVEATVVAAVNGSVDFTPYLHSGSDTAPGTPGFQGDYHALDVTTLGSQTGLVSRIQEGINMLAGSALYLAPGPYTGPVVISAADTLLGPNAGIDPCTGSRAAEAIITSTDPNGTIQVASNNVMLSGLKITGGVYGILVMDAYTGLRVTNNIIDGTSADGINLWKSAGSLVDYNQILNCTYGIGGGSDDASAPTSAIIEYNCISNTRLGITGYHNGSTIRYNSVSSFTLAPPAAGISGQLLNTIIRKNTVTGYTQGAGVSFQPYGVRPNSSNVLVDSNTVTGNGAGVYMIDPVTGLQVRANKFSNPINATDVNTSIYDANCWSDFSSNGGFPTQYNVPAGSNVDFNPNPNSCGDVDFLVTSLYMGCEAACIGDTLYLTFNQVGYLAGQILVQMPSQLDANWAAGTDYHSVMPGTNVSPNLVFAAGRRSAGYQLEINVQWQPPYSDGDGSKYIACIPIKNVSGTHGQSFTISGTTSTFYDGSGPHVNAFFLGTALVRIDCEDPVTSLTYTTPLTCSAFGAAAQLEGKITASVLRGTTPANSQLSEAYVEVNGNAGQRISLFASLLPGDYSNTSFPNAGDAITIFGWLNEGCNNLVLHGFDAECNEGISLTLQVIKDTAPPTLTVILTPPSGCFSDNPSSPTYGGTTLDEALDITTVLGTPPCIATTGTLAISYLAATSTLPLDVTLYPTDNTEALALWNWIKLQVPGANGGNYTFGVKAEDCAGNYDTDNFTICIDLSIPSNVVTYFNARPTHLGVWLKWTWDYNLLPSNAVAMEVWRSPLEAGDYPTYPAPNPARWQTLTNATYYPVSYPPAGWTMVAHQNGPSNNSAVYPGTHPTTIGADPAYWLDAIGTDTTGTLRDIYRYVTFVEDAGGNWSMVASYTLNKDADRSTNYWLGDYVPFDTPGSLVYGRVNSEDLGALSANYFTVVQPAWNYLDVGPENHENGYGKGIPTPDGSVNFFDLVPFSYNYGIVAPVGTQGEYRVVEPSSSGHSIGELDAQPVVSVTRTNENLLSVGDEFTVIVKLVGNTNHSVKIVEAELTYDTEVFELVSVSEGSVDVVDGVPFTRARAIEGRSGIIGAVAGACGEQAVLEGDVTLATITFIWKSDRTAGAQLELTTVNMADVMGTIFEGSGNTLSLNAEGTIPTRFALYQNYPNPFNPTTQIRFDLKADVDVRLVIFNVLGQEVQTLIAATMPAGAHHITWDGMDNSGQLVGSGLYIYRITAGTFVDQKKMLLTR